MVLTVGMSSIHVGGLLRRKLRELHGARKSLNWASGPSRRETRALDVASRRIPLTGNPGNPEERGELIGIGVQYAVHAIGGGRVVKIPNSMDGRTR